MKQGDVLMTNTALKYRNLREKRKNNPDIREKITKVVDSCDVALAEALELVQAAEAMLAKYPILDDATYQCSLQDIQRLSNDLAEIVKCRKRLDKERYISKLATGRLGAEIEHLGDDFVP
jgi:hypothetical protein